MDSFVPPYTVERAVLPDIVFPPPGEGEIVEDILEQILPEDDRSISRSDSFQGLEGLTQAVLAGNTIFFAGGDSDRRRTTDLSLI
jgi:hypothetical protein